MEWFEVTVVVAPTDVDATADVLRNHTGRGIAIEGAAPSGKPNVEGTTRLKGYLPADERFPSRRRALRKAFSRIALSRPLPPIRSRLIHEEDWANAWKKYFGIERVGRIVICPRWRRYQARDGEIVIRLDPGMAFGTGQHPTTRMCLLALQERLAGRKRVLDLGTGSGILSIAAARLGAEEVIALDNDPIAVEAAKENVAANGVAAAVTVAEGSLGDAWPAGFSRRRKFDCLVANISSATIMLLADGLVGTLARGGLGIAAGISDEYVEHCRQSLEAAGARVIGTMTESDWRTLLFEVR